LETAFREGIQILSLAGYYIDMKTLQGALLLIVIAATGVYSGYKLIVGPCDAPKEYRIGAFDTRFNISQAELLSALLEAEKVWEDAVGKDLFAYDASARMPVDMIYDERQETVIKNMTIESKIEEAEESAEAVKARFEAAKAAYESAKREYESLVDEYTTKLAAYNSEVVLWNAQGGASESDYKRSLKDKAMLDKLFAEVELKRQSVNYYGKKVNELVGKYNSIVHDVNEKIDIINESADEEFEQGQFKRDKAGERIAIYEFVSRDDLVRVLAHEFGHALDVDHNGNKNSIMYYLNSSENLIPTAEDIAGVKMACKFK
jgi:hypothetical protein